MRLSLSPAAIVAALSLVACSRPGERVGSDSAAAAADTAAAAAVAQTTPAKTASPTAAIVVLYNFPKDTAAFEMYYRETHLPLLGRHAGEIGFSRGVLMKFDRTADGKKPPYYRKAELWFPSEEAMTKGMATAGFQAVGADFANFVTNGGPTILISHETNNQ